MDQKNLFTQSSQYWVCIHIRFSTLKKLIRTGNWFFCEMIQQPVFLPVYKCYSQRGVSRIFQKDWFFLKKIDSFKESERTYSFYIFTLFVLNFFWHKVYFLFMYDKDIILFVFAYVLYYVSCFNFQFWFHSLHSLHPPSVFPCYCRKINSYKSQVDGQRHQKGRLCSNQFQNQFFWANWLYEYTFSTFCMRSNGFHRFLWKKNF